MKNPTQIKKVIRDEVRGKVMMDRIRAKAELLASDLDETISDEVGELMGKLSTDFTDEEWDTMQYLLGGGFDIVLLDILLKGNENGMKILKTIKENPKTKDIPVVMFTNYTKKEVQDEAKKLGALDFIVKSETTPKMVAERVKELVAEDKKKACK